MKRNFLHYEGTAAQAQGVKGDMRDSKGMSFVAIMIVMALTALFLRFSIEQLIRWNIGQCEGNARETLKLVSTAIENYAKNHLGMYPGNLSVLSESTPPYIAKAYTQMGVVKGYLFNCSVLAADGYSCSAAPVRCKLTGSKVFRVTTGGSMTQDACTP